MKHLRLLLAPALALALLPAVEARADEACVDSPAMGFGPFHVDATPPLFYGVEGGDGSFNLRWTSATCGLMQGMSAQYTDTSGSALEGPDYNLAGGQTPQVCEWHCPPQATVHEPAIANDPHAEAVAESLLIHLSNPVDGAIDPPHAVPFVIADDDGVSRVAFDDLPYSRSETYDLIAVPVWLAGPAPGGISVGYTAGPGPGAGATSPDDYTVTSPNPLTFGPGERVKLITLAVMNDKIAEPEEGIRIDLRGPVASPSSKVVTILDNEESGPPTSWYHHPRHNWKYKKSDYRIREFHVFTTDNPGGSGVVAAEIALRKNLKNGSCSWLTPSGWQKKVCQNRAWLPTGYDDVGQLFYYRMKQLKSSVGTRIENYTAFCRALDGAGNLESQFGVKRNANTFEIKRSRRR